MLPAAHHLLPARQRAPFRQRAISLSLSAGLVALILIGLFALAPNPTPPRLSQPPIFSYLPSSEPKAASKPKPRRAEHAKHTPDKKKPPPPAQPKPIVTTPSGTLPGVIPLDLASTDIGKIRSKSPAHTSDDDSADSADSASVYGPGEGPGGVRLYKAEWYVHPSHAQLAYYLPDSGAPEGAWAVIACQTEDHYRVDNCRQLGESPVGSGLARAIRRAAWQFRVRPPRVGGHKLIGAWVRIEIYFTASGEKPSG